jgi:hypothetical protein
MIRPVHPHHVGEQALVVGHGPGQIPGGPSPMGEIVPGAQRGRMVRSEDTFHVQDGRRGLG